MKSELEDAYQLTYEVNHFKEYGLDWSEDLLIEKYNDYDKFAIKRTESFAHPNPVVFQGELDVVKHIDYPVTDNLWDVMSQEMLQTLVSVGNFPHRAISVAVLDWQVQKKDWFDTAGNLRKEICLENYVALQLTEYQADIDYETSEYETADDEPDRILYFTKYAFKRPENGFPPLFKAKEIKNRLFISAKARIALKETKITGTRYISLDGYQVGEQRDWVDTPIILPDEVYK